MLDAVNGPSARVGQRAHYDSVIVGGGIAGLVCGTQLAQLGKRTLIVERSAQPGGCCSSFTQKGFTFDVAVHHISGCGRLSIVGSCLRALGIECEFVRLDPMDTIVFPSWSLPIPTRLDAFAASLAQRFPRERAGVDAFFAELVKLYRALLDERRESPTLARYQDLTFAEMLDGFFDDPRIKLGLSGQWGYLGSPPQELSAVGMCQMVVNYWRDGAYYPRGGTQAFADAIAARFVACGGDLLVSTTVRELIADGRRVAGVRLADGRDVGADTVVSNVDPAQTFFRLLDGEVEPAYAERLRAMRVSSPFVLLYLGVDARCDPTRLARGFYFFSEELGGPWLYVSSSTEIEPRMAPPGCHTMTIVASLTPEEEAAGDWRTVQETKVRDVLNRIEDFVPGLRQHVQVMTVAHPPSGAERTSNFCGAPYGWAVIPEQSGMRRLAHETPIDNLYLTGHWTIPGPGVCAVVASGWRVANRIAARESPATRASQRNTVTPVPA
jgi:phytoene dehydrogenase-like protein